MFYIPHDSFPLPLGVVKHPLKKISLWNFLMWSQNALLFRIKTLSHFSFRISYRHLQNLWQEAFFHSLMLSWRAWGCHLFKLCRSSVFCGGHCANTPYHMETLSMVNQVRIQSRSFPSPATSLHPNNLLSSLYCPIQWRQKGPKTKNVSFVIFIFCLIYFLQVFPLRLHAAFVHHYYSAEMPISRLQLLPAIQLFHRVCPRYINLHTTRYKQISGNFSPSVFLLSFSSYFFFLSCFTLILSHSLPLSFSFTLSSSLFLFFRLLCLSLSVALTGIHARRHSCNIQRRGWEGHARTCMSPL